MCVSLYEVGRHQTLCSYIQSQMDQPSKIISVRRCHLFSRLKRLLVLGRSDSILGIYMLVCASSCIKSRCNCGKLPAKRRRGYKICLAKNKPSETQILYGIYKRSDSRPSRPASINDSQKKVLLCCMVLIQCPTLYVLLCCYTQRCI